MQPFSYSRGIFVRGVLFSKEEKDVKKRKYIIKAAALVLAEVMLLTGCGQIEDEKAENAADTAVARMPWKRRWNRESGMQCGMSRIKHRGKTGRISWHRI